MRHTRDVHVRHAGDLDLRLLDDAAIVLADCEEVVDPRGDLPDNSKGQEQHMTNNDSQCAEHRTSRPQEAASNDPEVLRAALIREAAARGRAECNAKMQADVVKLAIDLLVREPDLVGFFVAMTKTMVEEGESVACGVWLLDQTAQHCH